MIESLMFAAIGFLSASLMGAFMIAEVHRRAVRLTTRRLQISNRLITEILAAKDQQRAEYALYTARLETTIRELRQRTTSLLTSSARGTPGSIALKSNCRSMPLPSWRFVTL